MRGQWPGKLDGALGLGSGSCWERRGRARRENSRRSLELGRGRRKEKRSRRLGSAQPASARGSAGPHGSESGRWLRTSVGRLGERGGRRPTREGRRRGRGFWAEGEGGFGPRALSDFPKLFPIEFQQISNGVLKRRNLAKFCKLFQPNKTLLHLQRHECNQTIILGHVNFRN